MTRLSVSHFLYCYSPFSLSSRYGWPGLSGVPRECSNAFFCNSNQGRAENIQFQNRLMNDEELIKVIMILQIGAIATHIDKMYFLDLFPKVPFGLPTEHFNFFLLYPLLTLRIHYRKKKNPAHF